MFDIFLNRFTTIIIFLCFGTLNAEQAPLSVNLVSEQTQIQAGQTFRAGIFQKIDPGFHTYYKNPGKLGLATNITWELPHGFEAGPIIWPVPQETTMSAYTVWGYENSALLLSEITVPANLKSGTMVELRARVTYMCCSTTCHPGATQVRLRLQVGKNKVFHEVWHQKFTLFDKKQPVTSDRWLTSCIKNQDRYQIQLKYLKKGIMPDLTDLKLFTDKRLIDSDTPIAVTKMKDGYLITAKAEKYVGLPPDVLHGILTTTQHFGNGEKAILVSPAIISKRNTQNQIVPKMSIK